MKHLRLWTATLLVMGAAYASTAAAQTLTLLSSSTLTTSSFNTTFGLSAPTFGPIPLSPTFGEDGPSDKDVEPGSTFLFTTQSPTTLQDPRFTTFIPVLDPSPLPKCIQSERIFDGMGATNAWDSETCVAAQKIVNERCLKLNMLQPCIEAVPSFMAPLEVLEGVQIAASCTAFARLTAVPCDDGKGNETQPPAIETNDPIITFQEFQDPLRTPGF